MGKKPLQSHVPILVLKKTQPSTRTSWSRIMPFICILADEVPPLGTDFFIKFQNFSKNKSMKTKNSDLWESAPKALRDFKLIGSVPSEERIAGPVEPQVICSFRVFVSKLSAVFFEI